MKKYITGDDGDREWLCEHGIGHGNNVHTCDGCCTPTSAEGQACVCEMLDKPTYDASRDPHSLEKNWDCPKHGHQERYWLIHEKKQPYCIPCGVPALEVEEREQEFNDRNFTAIGIPAVSEHKTWESGFKQQNEAAQKFWDIVDEYATEDDIFLRLEHLMVLEIAHAKEEGRNEVDCLKLLDRARKSGIEEGRAESATLIQEASENGYQIGLGVGRAAAQRETVEEAVRHFTNVGGTWNVAGICDVLRSLAPTPEQPPKV